MVLTVSLPLGYLDYGVFKRGLFQYPGMEYNLEVADTIQQP